MKIFITILKNVSNNNSPSWKKFSSRWISNRKDSLVYRNWFGLSPNAIQWNTLYKKLQKLHRLLSLRNVRQRQSGVKLRLMRYLHADSWYVLSIYLKSLKRKDRQKNDGGSQRSREKLFVVPCITLNLKRKLNYVALCYGV